MGKQVFSPHLLKNKLRKCSLSSSLPVLPVDHVEAGVLLRPVLVLHILHRPAPLLPAPPEDIDPDPAPQPLNVLQTNQQLRQPAENCLHYLVASAVRVAVGDKPDDRGLSNRGVTE